MCRDPERFGRIAAANALSDVYAMGGKPLFAMNVCCFPFSELPGDVLAAVLKGACSKLEEAETALAGGHTIDDEHLKFGLSVVGTVEECDLKTTSGARPGDVVILTKPIGTGLLVSADQAGMADSPHLEKALRVMETLNAAAAEAAARFDVSATTDVTGFSLVGHAFNIAESSDVTMVLDSAAVPLLDGALEAASYGLVPAGTCRNRRHYLPHCSLEKELDATMLDVLFDPQTSGGLLICVSGNDAPGLLSLLRKSCPESAVVGAVLEPGAARIVLR